MGEKQLNFCHENSIALHYIINVVKKRKKRKRKDNYVFINDPQNTTWQRKETIRMGFLFWNVLGFMSCQL